MLDRLTLTDFERHLGASFPAAPPGGEPVDLRLIEAGPLGPPAVAGGRGPFSLVFLGPGRPALGQRCYAIAHPDHGPLEIFIVPIGPAPGGAGFRYQAIFA